MVRHVAVESWNGQEAAFRFYITVLGVLIFVSLPDGDLGESARLRPAPPRRCFVKDFAETFAFLPRHSPMIAERSLS